MRVAHELNSARSSRRNDNLRGGSGLTTSIVDIDVMLTDIVFEHFGDGLAGFGAKRPSSLVDYAIEGIVYPGSAIDDGVATEPSLVYLSGYEDGDRMDRSEDVDQRSVCYISNDRRSDYAWSTNIYIERLIFRRLVELYATKRIDCVKISILLKVLRDASGAVDVPTLNQPVLRTMGDRHRRHSRAHLMSVQMGLGAKASFGSESLVHAAPWRTRLGRRQVSGSQR